MVQFLEDFQNVDFVSVKLNGKVESLKVWITKALFTFDKSGIAKEVITDMIEYCFK